MAKSRMAGDALRDEHYAARERIANDPERSAEKMKRVGDNYDLEGYSDKEVIMAFKGDTFGDDDYTRLTGKTVGNGEKEPDVQIKPLPGDGSSPVTEPTPKRTPEEPGRPGLRPIVLPEMGDGSQTQVVNQDNDVNTNVTGDGNVTNIDQDNSVRQYGAYGSAASRSKALRDKYVADISKFTAA
jgi:hypothetical protein